MNNCWSFCWTVLNLPSNSLHVSKVVYLILIRIFQYILLLQCKTYSTYCTNPLNVWEVAVVCAVNCPPFLLQLTKTCFVEFRSSDWPFFSPVFIFKIVLLLWQYVSDYCRADYYLPFTLDDIYNHPRIHFASAISSHIIRPLIQLSKGTSLSWSHLSTRPLSRTMQAL